MKIDDLSISRQYLPLVQQQNNFAPTAKTSGSESFADSLKNLIQDVNTLQQDSSNLTDMMIKGEPVDVHDVMIASEKAKTGFTLLLELRNKFLDTYKEISRMSV